MSNFIKGDALILWFWDTSGTPAYKPVACLTSNSLSQTRNIIESQTKCAPGLVEKDSGRSDRGLLGKRNRKSDGKWDSSHSAKEPV